MMENKQREYLHYIQLMYEREAGKGTKSGITKWGIVIGIVYVAWHFIESYSQIIDKPVAHHAAIFLFGFIFISIDAFSYLFRDSTTSGSKSRFNLRIKENSVWEINSSIVVTCLILFGLPLLSQLGKDTYIYTQLSWPLEAAIIDAQAKINFYYLCFFLLVTPTYFFFSQLYEKKKELPTPISIIAQTKGPNILHAFRIINVELAFGNAVAAYTLLNLLPATDIRHILTSSFDASLITFALVYISSHSLQNVRAEQILTLERDVLFHDLTNDDIKFRIQEELIGHEFGEWLSSKLSEIRIESNALVCQAKCIGSAIEKLREHRSPNESEEPIQAAEEFKRMQQQLEGKLNPILVWMETIISNSGSYDKYVVSLIQERFNELSKIRESTGKQISEILDPLLLSKESKNSA